MRVSQIAVLILGILGGLFGILSALATWGLGGLAGLLGYEKAGEVIWRGVGAILLTIIGMVGAGIGGNKPKTSGILMLLASIIGFLIIFPLYIPASVLFLAGSILAFISKKEQVES